MRDALEDLDIRPSVEAEEKVNESLRGWVEPTLDKHDKIRKLHFRHIDMHPVDPDVKSAGLMPLSKRSRGNRETA